MYGVIAHNTSTTYPILITAKTYLWSLYNTCVLNMLFRLYIGGPSFAGYGFWEGQQNNEICAQMTRSSSSFWDNNHSECDAIIFRRFYSWVILFESSVMFFFMIAVILRAIRRFF